MVNVLFLSYYKKNHSYNVVGNINTEIMKYIAEFKTCVNRVIVY